MQSSPIISPGWTNRANAALDALLYRISVWGVPGAIGALSLVALLAWNGEYVTSGSNPLDFRVFEQTGEAPTPAQALARLKDLSAVDRLDTKLSESPFWFSFTPHAMQAAERTYIEFPSRHALDISCWDAGKLNSLGSANRDREVGQL